MKFIDIEAAAIAYLEREENITTVQRIRSPRPDEFYRVYRTGGSAVNPILDRPFLTVEAWAKSAERAAEMIQAARQRFLNPVGLSELVRGRGEEITGPYFVPDDESQTPRYRFTVALNVRATRAA